MHVFRTQRARAGFSLVELVVVIGILTVSVSMLTSTLISASRHAPIQRESAIASNAARTVLETMRAEPLDRLFALYNADPDDDPDGAGTAPGPSFAIPGLEARATDEDGLPGRIVLPAAGAPLREDANLPELGMPRDLDADGAIDSADHSGNYVLLPVLVRIEWSGATGDRSLLFHTMLAHP
jgi:prepilin-type N-terminal cleavage/methylation domain-containing protein